MNIGDLLNGIKNLGKAKTGTLSPTPSDVMSLFKASPVSTNIGGNYKPIDILSPEGTAKPAADLKKTLSDAKAMGDQVEAQSRKFGEKVLKPIAKGTQGIGFTLADIFGRTVDAAFGLPGRIVTGFDKSVPVGFSEQVGKAGEQTTGNKTVGSILGGAAGLIEPIPGGGETKLAGHFTEPLLKALAAEEDAGKIAKLLSTEGKLPAEVAGKISPQIAKTGTAEGVASVLGKVPEAGANAAVAKPSKEQTLYHGTSAPDFNNFKGDKGGVVYLTSDPAEAQAFADNPIIGGGRGKGTPRVLEVKAPEGKTKSIDDAVQNVIMEGGDLDATVAAEAKKARKEGYDFLSFNHPSSVDGSKDFEAIVSVNPEKLKINTPDVSGETQVKIPTTKIHGFKGAEIEVPVAKAVEATYDEGAVSSGFHGSLNDRWTIVYKDPSAELISAAKEAGLDVAVREAPKGTGQMLTDISIPALKAGDQKAAKAIFDKFADIYMGTGAPEARPTGTGTMKSVGDILAEKGVGGGKPPVSGETTVGGMLGGEKPPERRFVKRAKEMASEADPALFKGTYDKRSTDALIARADSRIAKDPGGAMTFAKTDTTDEGVATASRLIDSFVNQAKLAGDEATKTALYEKAADIANTAAANLTEHGRAVQAASILGRQTPEGMVRWAAGEIQKYNEVAGSKNIRNFLGGAKKIPELNAEQTAHIADEMQKIADMPEGKAKAMAFKKLTDEVKSMIPSSLYQKIISLWKAGLLTGIKTSGLNIASNATHALSEIAKDVPAAVVDKIASLFTGERTLALTTKGEIKGTAEGIQNGWQFMRTGYDPRNTLSAMDFKKVNFGDGKIGKALQAYEEGIFGLLGAEDQPFYYGAKARSLASQAIAMAKNEGLKGTALADRVSELTSNPTDQMLKYAVMDAQVAVFQNKTVLGTAGKALQKVPGGEVLLPFAKTPAAVATQLINYSPAGIVKTIIENIGKGRFDQRLFSQGIGRGLTGTGVLAIGAALYGAGMMTTSPPTSEKEKKEWQIEGKQANAVKIGGKWRGVGVLGPLGMVLAVGANMQQGFSETGSFIGGLGAAAAGAGSALTQQTFLYGINQAINALNDPSRYGANFIQNTIGSIVPTIVADVARATDTNERQVNSIGEKLTSRIPGLREMLQPQIDTLGQKIKTPSFFTVMADPTRPYLPTESLNDPAVKELMRLDNAGFNATPTMLGGTHGFKSLTEPQNTQLWEMAGGFAHQAIQKVMANPQYPKWDDEKRAKEIEQKVSEAKTEARARIIYYATKGLEGDALKKTLSTYKDDKLLSKEVYNRYKSIIRFGK